MGREERMGRGRCGRGGKEGREREGTGEGGRKRDIRRGWVSHK